ncbi:40S ribosomal protein S6 [Plecturocebus cupreus]
MPVIPVTREAEAGELPEPGRQRLHEPRWRHCTAAWETRAKLHRKKKERKMYSRFIILAFSCFQMKLHISFPATGCQKLTEVDDECKLGTFYEKRTATEVAVDALDQGELEKERKSVHGCIVDPNLSVLNLVLIKKGEKDIPGLTDTTVPHRLGPKRASRIHKLFNLSKEDDVRQHAVRKLLNREGRKPRTKAPKIQRLVTPPVLQRERWRIALKKRTQENKEEAAAYAELLLKRMKEAKEKRLQQIAKRRSLSSLRVSKSESLHTCSMPLTVFHVHTQSLATAPVRGLQETYAPRHPSPPGALGGGSIQHAEPNAVFLGVLGPNAPHIHVQGCWRGAGLTQEWLRSDSLLSVIPTSSSHVYGFYEGPALPTGAVTYLCVGHGLPLLPSRAGVRGGPRHIHQSAEQAGGICLHQNKIIKRGFGRSGQPVIGGRLALNPSQTGLHGAGRSQHCMPRLETQGGGPRGSPRNTHHPDSILQGPPCCVPSGSCSHLPRTPPTPWAPGSKGVEEDGALCAEQHGDNAATVPTYLFQRQTPAGFLLRTHWGPCPTPTHQGLQLPGAHLLPPLQEHFWLPLAKAGFCDFESKTPKDTAEGKPLLKDPLWPIPASQTPPCGSKTDAQKAEPIDRVTKVGRLHPVPAVPRSALGRLHAPVVFCFPHLSSGHGFVCAADPGKMALQALVEAIPSPGGKMRLAVPSPLRRVPALEEFRECWGGASHLSRD